MWQKIRDYFDAPRFCSECGKPIEVISKNIFNSNTGKSTQKWAWSCPEVDLVLTSRGITRASQWGYTIHPYGSGRPNWHKNSNSRIIQETE